MKRILASPIVGILASALLLTGILGALIIDRVRLLTRGREIVLPIRPVDPRDLFKGDYARLGFDIHTLDQSLVAAKPPSDGKAWLNADRTVFVTLEQQTDQTWKPVAVDAARPQGLAPNRIALKGRIQRWNARRVTYGIERYYVPEGTGPELETLARSSKLSAIVAVDAAGRAAIKGLVTDGRKIYEEPLF